MACVQVAPVAIEWVVSSLRTYLDGIQEEANSLQAFKEQGNLPEEAVEAYREMLDEIGMLDGVLTRLEYWVTASENRLVVAEN